MDHKAKITISRPSYGCGKRKMSISVKDCNSKIRFLEIEIDLDKFTEALTGLAETDCEINVRGLCNVGKLKETMGIEARMPKCEWNERHDVALIVSQANAPLGWICSSYFGSKESFFQKDGKDYVRTTASRWVDNKS